MFAGEPFPFEFSVGSLISAIWLLNHFDWCFLLLLLYQIMFFVVLGVSVSVFG